MSSYAIISDVHANLEALNRVLGKIDSEKIDSLLFLGDSIGYGPDPNECIELLKARSNIMLAGNHDRGATDMTETLYFNPYAKTALEWTVRELSDESKEFLQTLPLTETMESDDLYLVHSTPREPEQWHYLHSKNDARLNFNYFDQKICVLGHSHVPFIAQLRPGGTITFEYSRIQMEDENRYIANVGSVGQPRDGNPQAAYVLLRDNTVEIKRVSYDIVSTQKKMRKAGLPSFLIDRLAAGK
jgi:predicted phosphodiesterase